MSSRFWRRVIVLSFTKICPHMYTWEIRMGVFTSKATRYTRYTCKPRRKALQATAASTLTEHAIQSLQLNS